MQKPRLLVIGNGMASLRFLEDFMSIAPGAHDIIVVGEEPEPAYNRVLLSPLLAGEIAANGIALKERAWYAAHGIQLLTGDQVVALNTNAKLATLSSGPTINFDIAVLATGSDAVRLPVPGASLPGVYVFRTLGSISKLTAAAYAGERVVVIGGGLLGIEAAYGLQRSGAKVTLLHVMDRLMERQLDAESAGILKAAIEARGIEVVLNADTAAIEGDETVRAVRLKDGRRIETSLVVMAIGIRPRVELAKHGGLATARGILVDDRMMTSVEDIYAIGECAEHKGAVYGLVEPVYEHARVAAHIIAGKQAAFTGMTLSTNLKVSGLPVFSAGDFEARNCEHILWRDHANSAYRKFCVRNQRLIGTVLIGDTTDALWYRDLIRDRVDVSPFRATLPFGRSFSEAA